MMDYFEKSRVSYLLPKGKKILIGDNLPLRKGFIQLTKEQFINRVDELDPSVLWLVAENEGENCTITKFLSQTLSLKSLKISNDYLPLNDLFSSNLKAISLVNFTDRDLLERYEEFTWSSGQVLSNVEFFSFFDLDGRYDLGGISPTTFPALKWIECFIDKKGKTLDTIQGFSNLTTAYLQYVRKHDVFSILQDLDIKMLKLEGFDRGFSFQTINKLSNLEVLHLNGYRENLDLGLLANLQLKEVYILNCPKLEHSEALLQIPSLESIHVINCKKPLSEEVVNGLKDRLQVVNIDFQ